MSECNALEVTALNQDCNRIAVKSNVQTSWMMTYKRGVLARNKKYDIAFTKDELIVLTFQDGSGYAEIKIRPIGEKVGTVIAQSSRNATQTLRVGRDYTFGLKPGESVIFRGNRIVHPTHAGAGLAV